VSPLNKLLREDDLPLAIARAKASRRSSNMAKTGEKCLTEGHYTGICTNSNQHHVAADFTVGDIFTACSTCGGLHQRGGAVVNWAWARPIRK
jgi:hypothetical protein